MNYFSKIPFKNNPTFLALSAIALWSTVAGAFKIALRSVEPETLLFYSSLFSLLIIFSILLFYSKFSISKFIKSFEEYEKRDILKALLMGFLNPFCYYFCLFQAYNLLKAQQALTLNYSWAVIFTLLSIPILKKKLNANIIIGALVNFVGILIISTKLDFVNFQFSSLSGVVFALASAFIWASFWLLNINSKLKNQDRLFLNFLSGTIFCAIYLMIYSISSSNSLSLFYIKESTSIFALMYIGFFEMGITFILWSLALQKSTNAAKTANLAYFSPFVSLILINFILGEKIEISTLVGFICVLLGIYIQKK
jgi:drug/metabolite transporter (DMT)-like permease